MDNVDLPYINFDFKKHMGYGVRRHAQTETDVPLPKLLVFGGPGKHSGSGFENLVRSTGSDTRTLCAEIVGVVSTNPDGGIRSRANALGVPFFHAPKPHTTIQYQSLAAVTEADFVALSGWLLPVHGLDPKTTFNIHRGTLPETAGLYGNAADQKGIDLFKEGAITETAVTMHFVTDVYDAGPVFCRIPVPIYVKDSPATLGARVSELERWWQPRVTNLVVQNYITWDGSRPSSLRHPAWYNPTCKSGSYLDWPTNR